MVTVEDVRAEVESMIEGVPPGPALTPLQSTFVGLAIEATPTVLNGPGISRQIEAALECGASPEEIHEGIVFVSGIALHTISMGTRRLTAILAEREDPLLAEPLDVHRQELVERYLGDRTRVDDVAMPGFFEDLVRISPAVFEGFFGILSLAVTNEDAVLDPLIKEFMGIAIDAVPSHRFLPTMGIHIDAALVLGAGRRSILETLDLAAAAPAHPGVPLTLGPASA